MPSNETTGVFCLFHPLVKVDFHPKIEVILNQKAFVFALARSSHLFLNGPSSMVYEFLRDCFVLDHFTNGFDLFFEGCGHIA
jgi:hypothetical protein